MLSKIKLGVLMGEILLVGLAQNIRAEEEAVPTLQLEEIIVTGTRIETSVGEVPASVTIINKDELKNAPHQRIDDVLESNSGIDIEGDFYAASPPRRVVSLRGVGDDQGRTLILFNGVPMNSPISGWVEWSGISLNDVDRIEIVRGPLSSLYGDGAMGGVINIITAKPEERKTFIETNFGSLNAKIIRITQSGKFKKFGYYLGGDYFLSDGYIADLEPEWYTTKRDRDEKSFYVNFSQDLDEKSLITTGVRYLDLERGWGKKYWDYEKISIGSFVNYKRSNFKTALFYNNDFGKTFFPDRTSYDKYVSDIKSASPNCGINSQIGLDITSGYKLFGGLDLKYNYAEQYPTYYDQPERDQGFSGKQYIISPFLHNKLDFFNKKLTLHLGARYDWVKSFDGHDYGLNVPMVSDYDKYYEDKVWDALSPKLGLNYHYSENTILYTSIGKSFRAPTLRKLFMTSPYGMRIFAANPDLKPEKMLSYEAGFKKYFMPLLLKFTLYQNKGEDFISSILTSPTTSKSVNITKVKITGLEGEINYEIANYWRCFLTYTYKQPLIEKYDPDPTISGNDLCYTSRNTGSIGIIFNHPEVTVNLTSRYIGEKYSDDKNSDKLDDYNLVDLKIRKQFLKKLEVTFSMENIFDQEYETRSGLFGPGRFFNGSLSYKF